MHDVLEGAAGLIIRQKPATSTTTLRRQVAALKATGFVTLVGVGHEGDPVLADPNLLTVPNYRPEETGQLFGVWLGLSRVPEDCELLILFDDADPHPGVIAKFSQVLGISAALDPVSNRFQLLHVPSTHEHRFRSAVEDLLLDDLRCGVGDFIEANQTTTYRAVLDGSAAGGSRTRWIWPSLHPTKVAIELDRLTIDLTAVTEALAGDTEMVKSFEAPVV